MARKPEHNELDKNFSLVVISGLVLGTFGFMIRCIFDRIVGEKTILVVDGIIISFIIIVIIYITRFYLSNEKKLQKESRVKSLSVRISKKYDSKEKDEIPSHETLKRNLKDEIEPRIEDINSFFERLEKEIGDKRELGEYLLKLARETGNIKIRTVYLDKAANIFLELEDYKLYSKTIKLM